MSLLENVKNEFYDRWESLNDEKRRRIISARLQKYVTFARDKVPFYRSRLKKYGKNADFPLAHVPVLSSGEIRKLLPPKSSVLLTDKKSPYTVFQSGGTTGNPKTSLFTHVEIEQLTLPNARGFFALGLSRKDRVANLFAVGGLYMTFIHINRMLQEYGCVNFPFSNRTSPDFLLSIIKLFKINCVAGITSAVMTALREMDKTEPGAVKIEKIFYGGERIYEADRKYLREKFGAKLIAAPGYGAIDTWYIGYQCLKCPPGVFHAHDDQCYIEIVDEEKAKYCGPLEQGILYATPFLRRLTPIVRYKVGDKAEWLGEKCPCGRTTPLFRLLGRGDDVLRIGYDSVDYGCIMDCAARTKTISGAVQIEKRRQNGMDRLIVRAETNAGAADYPRICAELERKILSLRPTLSESILKKSVLPIKIELLAPGSIPGDPRTGKLRRVIDLL